MSKHTPKPWLAGAIMGRDENAHKPGVIDITYHGRTIATITPGTMSGDSLMEAEANALLIEAAPDMLEALKNLENDDGSIPQHAWKMVKAAIAKAEGK